MNYPNYGTFTHKIFEPGTSSARICGRSRSSKVFFDSCGSLLVCEQACSFDPRFGVIGDQLFVPSD